MLLCCCNLSWNGSVRSGESSLCHQPTGEKLLVVTRSIHPCSIHSLSWLQYFCCLAILPRLYLVLVVSCFWSVLSFPRLLLIVGRWPNWQNARYASAGNRSSSPLSSYSVAQGEGALTRFANESASSSSSVLCPAILFLFRNTCSLPTTANLVILLVFHIQPKVACHVFSCSSRLVVSCLVSPCLILSCPVLSDLVSPCLVLSGLLPFIVLY